MPRTNDNGEMVHSKVNRKRKSINREKPTICYLRTMRNLEALVYCYVTNVTSKTDSVTSCISDLIRAVMLLSEAVLFHRDMMSSVGLMDITTPHISSPTMNCSPSIASS